MTGFVRTVLGDVHPSELGITYCHEHLIIDTPIVAERFPHIHLPSVEDAVAEASLCRKAGVGTMVDAMPGGGREIDRLREVSRQTGMHIVSASGLHTEQYYELTLAKSPEDLAERFMAEIESGCGVIKAATGPDGVNERARCLFEAASIAHGQTGAPIITHCEEGQGGLEQLALLSDLSVNLDRVVLSHTDKVIDLAYHRDLLDSRVNLEYDQALRQAGSEDQTTAWLVISMIEAGFVGQLMLGTDGARRSLWRTLGGSPGLAWLFEGFVPLLEDLGLGETELTALLIDNPARWLKFS